MSTRSREPVCIALAGPMCSGKTYVSEWLQRRYGQLQFQRIGFGDEVKRFVQLLWNPSKKDRKLLVEFATSMRAIDEDIWVNRMLQKIDHSNHQHWICDDLRQHNELSALQKRGWLLVRICVPEDVRRARLQTNYPDDYQSHLAYSQHSTENEMDETREDVFACTIDTSDEGQWSETLDTVIQDRFNVHPSSLSTSIQSLHSPALPVPRCFLCGLLCAVLWNIYLCT